MTGKRTLEETHGEDRSKKKKANSPNPINEKVENNEEQTDKTFFNWESDAPNGDAVNNSLVETVKSKEKDTADQNNIPNDDYSDIKQSSNLEKGLETCKDIEEEQKNENYEVKKTNVEKENDEKEEKKTKEMAEVTETQEQKEKEVVQMSKDERNDQDDKHGEEDNGTAEPSEETIKTEEVINIEDGNTNNGEVHQREISNLEAENEAKKEENDVEKKGENDVEKKGENGVEKKEENGVEKKEENNVEKKKENNVEKKEESDINKNEEKDVETNGKKDVEKKDGHDTEKIEEDSVAKKKERDDALKKETNITKQENTNLVKSEKKHEESQEEKNQAKPEEIKESQETETTQKGNNNSFTNDVFKRQYVYGTASEDNKMYNMTVDSNYLNYSTNYLDQYYSTTSNCYSDITKSSVYNAYHNQQANVNTTTATIATTATTATTAITNNNTVAPISTNNASTNVSDMKKGKKHGYPSKGNYETEYKMDDKNGNYTKMPNMYLNNHMNHPSNGPLPNHMVNLMGGNMGNHMNYPGPAISPIPVMPPNPVPVSMAGANPNTSAAVSVSNNPMDNYYAYNYSYMNTPNCNNYYYMYDNKGYDYHSKEAESEKPYDFSAVIDKSLEMMKRNNKVKEILKHPARLQITPEELNKYEYTEGGDNYNIWFGKYVTDRYDKSAKNIPRFVAKYKCNPQKDSGYTKADRVYNNKQFFCIYFARGCCAYGSNCLYKHRVPTENDELEFEHTVDIFGREKFSTYKDDMSGVGCFNSDCRTLFIGSVFINNFNDAPKVEKLLYDEFSNFGNVDYVRFIPNKNIAFVQYSNRVNAEFAKVAMSDQPLENHSTALTIKWAYEFKHPPSNYTHYYNAPYVYNQNQIISPTWGNYLMQQQYGSSGGNNQMNTYMNGHPPSYPNSSSATAGYADYTNIYSAQYKKMNDRCNNINSNVHRMDQTYEPQGRRGGTQ